MAIPSTKAEISFHSMVATIERPCSHTGVLLLTSGIATTRPGDDRTTTLVPAAEAETETETGTTGDVEIETGITAREKGGGDRPPEAGAEAGIGMGPDPGPDPIPGKTGPVPGIGRGLDLSLPRRRRAPGRVVPEVGVAVGVARRVPRVRPRPLGRGTAPEPGIRVRPGLVPAPRAGVPVRSPSCPPRRVLSQQKRRRLLPRPNLLLKRCVCVREREREREIGPCIITFFLNTEQS